MTRHEQTWPRLIERVWRHPGNRRRRLRSVARVIAWRSWEALSHRPVVLRVGDVRFRCYPGSGSARQLIRFNGDPDFSMTSFVRHYLRPGDQFVDVGANIGSYTLLAAVCVGDTGRVHAFEPSSRSAARLRENIELNGFSNVHIHRAAAGAECGTVAFLVRRDSGNRIRTPVDAGEPTEEVPCVKLDEALSECSFVLGKMDIEGAEPLALQGAEGMLARQTPPVWLLEINGKLRHYGFSEDQFVSWLSARGYDTGTYDAESRKLEFHPDAWRRSVQAERGETNLVAVARSARYAVQARLERELPP